MVLMIVQLLFDISVHDFEVLFLFLRLRVNFEFFLSVAHLPLLVDFRKISCFYATYS